MKIKIQNWDKYQPRKDIKTPSWFRLQHSIIDDPDFYSLSGNEFRFFIYILCMASRKSCGEIFVNFDHCHRASSILEQDAVSAIMKLAQVGVITCENYEALRGRYADVTHPCATIQDKQDNTNKHENFFVEEKSKTSKKVFSEESKLITGRMWSGIVKNNPTAKPPNFENWQKEADLILRIDKRPLNEVLNLIDWCQSDNFWKSNILSVKKFREKYDQLKIRRESNANTTDSRRDRKPYQKSSVESERIDWREEAGKDFV